jgi:hypothetical protein
LVKNRKLSALLYSYDLENAADVEIIMPSSMIDSVAPKTRNLAKTGAMPRIKNPIKKVISRESMITSLKFMLF